MNEIRLFMKWWEEGNPPLISWRSYCCCFILKMLNGAKMQTVQVQRLLNDLDVNGSNVDLTKEVGLPLLKIGSLEVNTLSKIQWMTVDNTNANLEMAEKRTLRWFHEKGVLLLILQTLTFLSEYLRTTLRSWNSRNTIKSCWSIRWVFRTITFFIDVLTENAKAEIKPNKFILCVALVRISNRF